jgi:hypothetical protein
MGFYIMKIKLTPELSYLIGLWRKCKSFEGLGVRGRDELLETFSKEVLSQGIVPPDKLLTSGERVYFYHSAYRKFFQEVEKNQLERFKYLNDYAANYLAGMFDSVGNIGEDGVVSLSRMSKEDEMLLLRLGFNTKRRSGVLVVERPLVFLAFIKNYTRLFKGNKIFKYVNSKKRS